MANSIEQQLISLGFSDYEAGIYLELVKQSPASATFLAKKLKLSRSTVYTAIERLVARGVVGVSYRNEVKQFIAEPPTVIPNGTTTLEALVYAPNDEPVSYAWSWCPMRAGASDGFACALTEEELKAQLAAAGLPADDLTYDLGSSETAVFQYPVSPLVLAALCAAPLSGAGDFAPFLLNCDQGFPASIGLVIRKGSEEISAFKAISLALDAESLPNTNPSVVALAIARPGDAREAAILLESDARTYEVTLSEEYDLFAEVPEASAESFFGTTTVGVDPTDQREILILTWFIEGGRTRYQRTTYYEGHADFATLTENRWSLPEPEEFDGAEAQVFLVLRDNRGGVDWLTRRVGVVRP